MSATMHLQIFLLLLSGCTRYYRVLYIHVCMYVCTLYCCSCTVVVRSTIVLTWLPGTVVCCVCAAIHSSCMYVRVVCVCVCIRYYTRTTGVHTHTHVKDTQIPETDITTYYRNLLPACVPAHFFFVTVSLFSFSFWSQFLFDLLLIATKPPHNTVQHCNTKSLVPIMPKTFFTQHHG
jgi:hypothetical protein